MKIEPNAPKEADSVGVAIPKRMEPKTTTIKKIGGTIIDVLMPPLTPIELTAGYILGSITRGIIVALSIGVTLSLIIPIKDSNFI